MAERDCTYEWINSCQDVRDLCKGETDYIPFIDLYYCGINQNIPAIIAISIVFIAFVFNFISTTADTYLAPSLESMSKKFKLSEAVAGVTLLAFANGATDVVAGIVAGGKQSGGVTMAIGGLFGACLFTVTIVTARCIQGGGDIKTDDRGVKRDVGFLILSTLYFIGLTVLGTVHWYLALGFFLIYVFFIVYVIITERLKAARRASAFQKLSRVRDRLLSKTAQKVVASHIQEEPEDDEARKTRISCAWDQVLMPYLMKSLYHKRANNGLNSSLSDPKITDHLLQGDLSKDLSYLKEEAEKQEIEEVDNSLLGRFLRAINIPLLFIRNLTMPPFEEDNWNVYYAAATPFFGGVFFLWQTTLLQFFLEIPYLWIGFGICTTAASVAILWNGRTPEFVERYEALFATITFIMSALWLNLIVSGFMDLLSMVTVVSGLPLNFLTLTLLAWGNSMDDFFVDYIIAKAGNGRLAIAGVYGGQLFNMLVGFGGALLLQSIRKPIELNIYDFSPEFFKTNLLTVILLGTQLLVLIFTLVFGSLKKWVFGKAMMVLLMAVYVAFLVSVTLITFI